MWIKNLDQLSDMFKLTFRHGTTVSAHTIRGHLNEKGHNVRRPRRTPLLSQKHKKARLDFAKTYLRKSKSFGENVLLPEKTKSQLLALPFSEKK